MVERAGPREQRAFEIEWTVYGLTYLAGVAAAIGAVLIVAAGGFIWTRTQACSDRVRKQFPDAVPG
jgi:hypothetical protein